MHDAAAATAANFQFSFSQTIPSHSLKLVVSSRPPRHPSRWAATSTLCPEVSSSPAMRRQPPLRCSIAEVAGSRDCRGGPELCAAAGGARVSVPVEPVRGANLIDSLTSVLPCLSCGMYCTKLPGLGSITPRESILNPHQRSQATTCHREIGNGRTARCATVNAVACSTLAELSATE